MRRAKKWIQNSDLKEGALRNYVRRKYGDKAFTERGTIKVENLRRLANDPNVRERTRKRARLALTMRKF